MKNLERPIERIVDTIIEKRKLFLGLSVAFMAVLSIGLSSLKTDFSYRIWFNESNYLLQEFDKFEKQFGNDESIVVIMNSPSGLYNPAAVELIGQLSSDLELVQNVSRVDSLTTFEGIYAHEDDIIVEPFLGRESSFSNNLLEGKEAVLKDKNLPGYLIGPSENTTLIICWLKRASKTSLNNAKVLTDIEKTLSKYQGNSEYKFQVTGGPTLVESFRKAAEKDFKLLVPLVLILSFTILWLIFKSYRAVLGAFLPVIASVVGTMGVAGLFQIKINNITASIPQFLVAIGIAISVHIFWEYLKELKRHGDPQKATKKSLTKNFIPTFMTSLSTSIGFFSFSQAEIYPIAALGILSGIGTIFTWIFAYFLAGPLMANYNLLGDVKVTESKTEFRAQLWVNRILEYRFSFIALWIITTITFLTLGTKLEVNSDPLKYFRNDSPINKATRTIEKDIGGAWGLELSFDAGERDAVKNPKFLNKVEELNKWIRKQEGVTKVLSLSDYVKEVNQAFHADKEEFYKIPDTREAVGQLFFMVPKRISDYYMNFTASSMRSSVFWTLHDSNSSIALTNKILAKAEELGLKASATGKNLLYLRLNSYVVETFLTSIISALILISLLLVFVLRSVKLGMLALIPNVLPIIFGAGLLKLMGRPIDIGTVIVGSVCLGIAVDDTIHFIVNYQKLRDRNLDSEEAVKQIFQNTAPALLVTSLILSLGFGLFSLANFIPNQNFGILIAFMLLVALKADLILLPAILMRKKKKQTQHKPLKEMKYQVLFK